MATKQSKTDVQGLIKQYEEGSGRVKAQSEGLERVKGVASANAHALAKAVGINVLDTARGGSWKQATEVVEPTFKAWFEGLDMSGKRMFTRRAEVGAGYKAEAKAGEAKKAHAAGSVEAVVAYVAKADASDLEKIQAALTDRRVELAKAGEKKAKAAAPALPVLPAPAVGVDPALVAQILASLGVKAVA